MIAGHQKGVGPVFVQCQPVQRDETPLQAVETGWNTREVSRRFFDSRKTNASDVLTTEMRHRMKYVTALGVLTAALAAIPMASYSQQLAYTSKDVNLRAGPSTDYPVVAILPANIPISVEGCLSDYRWCDVIAGPNRGWAYSGNIIYSYQGSNVPLLTYGSMIGIGIIGFSIGNYWDAHYRSSPWYPQRQHWIDRPRPALRPGGRRLPPPGPGFGPGAGQRPPQGQRPGGAPRPPQGQGPGAGQRPPQGMDRNGGQHRPLGQRPPPNL